MRVLQGRCGWTTEERRTKRHRLVECRGSPKILRIGSNRCEGKELTKQHQKERESQTHVGPVPLLRTLHGGDIGMTLLRAMPGSCEDIHAVFLLDPAALWHPCRRQNVSPLRNSVKGAGAFVVTGLIRRRNKRGASIRDPYPYIETGDPNIGRIDTRNSQNQTSAQTLKKEQKEHGRLATSACCSPIFGLSTHNVLSDPSRLWDPQPLVKPFETLGTTTSR